MHLLSERTVAYSCGGFIALLLRGLLLLFFVPLIYLLEAKLTEKEKDIFYLLVHSSNSHDGLEVDQDETRRLELYLGLSHEWQEHSTWATFDCFFRSIATELD